jgi:ribosomal protein S18 acetylase RimI-like enzyme
VSGEIRRLELRDQGTLDALVALQRASYRVEADLLGANTLPALTESPRALRRSGETFLGRYEGERLAGAISWKRRRAVVDIHRLVVHPDFFRRGIARELIDALEADEPGAERMLVATGAANLPARRLYESRGFRAVDEHVVRGNITILTYERRLTA